MSNTSIRTLAMAVLLASVVGCSTTKLADPEVVDGESDGDTTEVVEETAGEDGTYGAGDDGVSGNSMSPEGGSADQLTLKEAAMSDTIVYFDYDRATIPQEEYEKMYAHAAYLAAYPNIRVRLEAHADERGSREYNLALAERRGRAAAKFLEANGVQPSQINMVSYGEERPMVDGHSESAWSRNRRVEMKY